MNVLLTGGTGLLGRAIIETRPVMPKIYSIYYGDYKVNVSNGILIRNTDISNRKNLMNVFLEAQPEVVIHTAGNASVDYCQKHYKAAYTSNVSWTRSVVEFCQEYNSKLVYISTNAIFDGNEAPYSEESIPNPINNYGKLKLECEGIVKNSGLEHVIIRPILMYGWNDTNERLNPVTWVLEKLKNRQKIHMVDDVYENPLLNYNCSEIIWKLIMLDLRGTYHIAGKDVVNRYEFAKLVPEIFGLGNGNQIEPVSSSFFRDIAPRPKNTSYNTSKIEHALNIRPFGLREGLRRMKALKSERVYA